MTPTKWERVKELFDEALKFSGTQRTAVLERAELRGPEVRTALEKLLADHDRLIGESGPFVLDDVQVPSIYSLSRRFAADDLVAHRYRIVRFIAQGGMGEVYEAHDLELDRRVALKVLRDELNLDPDSIERFKHEITLAQRVAHPNVCRIFDLGRHRLAPIEGESEPDAVVFLTMELLTGETLAEYLERNGPMTCSEALPLVLQMAEALSALHEARVVHRDFKPGNVMLIRKDGEEPRVVVTDLGLARSTPEAGEEAEPTTKTLLICTPEYVAPEQLTGEPANPATDVFAFGLVLYEMVAGERPFSAPTPLGSIVKRLTTPPKRPSEVVAGLDRHWEATILRCLEREQEKRFSSVQKVIQALEGESENRLRSWLKSAAVVVLAVLASALLALLAPASAVEPLLDRACEFAPGWSFFCHFPADKDVAILPFENLSVGEANEVYAEGLVDYAVKSFQQLAPDKDTMCVHVREDRNAFGVKLVLTGSVRKERDSVRVQAAVHSIEKGLLLRRLDKTIPVSDTGALQYGLADDLLGTLDINLPEADWQAWQDRGTGVPAAFHAFIEGIGYLKRRDFSNAAAKLAQATDESHDFAFVRAHVALGDAYRLGYELTNEPKWAQSAYNAYTLASGLRDDLPELHFGLGQLELSRKNYDLAQSHFERSLELDPYDFDTQRSLSRTFQTMGAPELAEAENQRIIDSRPECWYTYNHAAFFYRRRGSYEEAQRNLLKVIQLAPKNATAHNNLSHLYRIQGRYSNAIERAIESVQLSPRAHAYMTLGLAYLYQGCTSEAVQALETAREAEPNNYRVLTHLGEAYERVPEARDRAGPLYEKAIASADVELRRKGSQFNDRIFPLRYLALNGARVGKIESARSAIEELREIDEDGALVLFYTGLVHEYASERRQAIDKIIEALSGGYSVHEVRNSPDLADLRNSAEFRRRLRQAGLSLEAEPGDTSVPTGEEPCPPFPEVEGQPRTAAGLLVQ